MADPAKMVFSDGHEEPMDRCQNCGHPRLKNYACSGCELKAHRAVAGAVEVALEPLKLALQASQRIFRP